MKNLSDPALAPTSVTDAAPRSSIERLLAPHSVALLGASPTPGSLGAGVIGNLARFGFAGEVHFINPGRAEIDGKACLKSPLELPHGVDCAVLAIPAAKQACWPGWRNSSYRRYLRFPRVPKPASNLLCLDSQTQS